MEDSFEITPLCLEETLPTSEKDAWPEGVEPT
jgi:hypothetical protein